MADDDTARSSPEPNDTLLFRVKGKKQRPVRAPEPIVRLLDPLRHRAGDTGCGEVGRDELVAALLVAAARASDEELRGAIESYRRARVSDVAPN